MDRLGATGCGGHGRQPAAVAPCNVLRDIGVLLSTLGCTLSIRNDSYVPS